jgi:hypothetical protein
MWGLRWIIVLSFGVIVGAQFESTMLTNFPETREPLSSSTTTTTTTTAVSAVPLPVPTIAPTVFCNDSQTLILVNDLCVPINVAQVSTVIRQCYEADSKLCASNIEKTCLLVTICL